VVHEVTKRHKKVLLLASSTSLRLGLYQIPLARAGVSYVIPALREYRLLDNLILGVLEGRDRKDLMEKLVHLAERHVATEGVEAIVLGCTELPLVFPSDFRLPVYSSLSVLAESLLKRYYKEVL